MHCPGAVAISMWCEKSYGKSCVKQTIFYNSALAGEIDQKMSLVLFIGAAFGARSRRLHQPPHPVQQHRWKHLWPVQQAIPMAAEHAGQVAGTLRIDRQAER